MVNFLDLISLYANYNLGVFIFQISFLRSIVRVLSKNCTICERGDIGHEERREKTKTGRERDKAPW